MSAPKERPWHMAATFAGTKPGDPRYGQHYDIGAADNENIALVYPAEDGPGVTAKRARRIAAVNPLYDALTALVDEQGENPWWWVPVLGGGRCAMCECGLSHFPDNNQHAPDCPVRQALEAIDLADGRQGG